MASLPTRVTVKVPATSANLGAGYDCIGMAVDIWNVLTVEYAPEFSIQIEGEGADVLPVDSSNLVILGVEMAFKHANIPMPKLAYFCQNRIPFGSGLGSSSAAITSGLLAGLVLTGQKLKCHGAEELLQIAASVEGHTDNLAPCIYGGVQVGVYADDRWQTQSVPVPIGLRCVIFVPSTPMSTAEARALLPNKVDREDAVFNLSRTALLVLAFSTGRLELLRTATEDRLHQPYRGNPKVMPALFPCIDAATKAGATCAFLSGAGSSILAVTTGVAGEPSIQNADERRDAQVAEAMVAAAASVGVQGKVYTANPTTMGAHVTQVSGDSTGPVNTRMRYRSTRSSDGTGATGVTFEAAIMRGLAPDGGLYVPERIPELTPEEIKSWRALPFAQLAVKIMSKFIGEDEIPQSSLEVIVEKSYSTFDTSHVTPLVKMSDDGSLYLLEQFHGPTCAFKDVALQFLGNLFEYFLARRSDRSETEGRPSSITVLGATSGDTGSAAIEGLRGKKGVQVYILHPKGRVAPVQEAQMTTVLDDNVHNIAVNGTFDDCQSMVKALFNDEGFRSKHTLAAINSINWARIMAQIVYYFYAYFRWQDDAASRGEAFDPTRVNFVVPTGNFGNALAGFYAREMGLPVNRLVVATNQNDILFRFLQHGDYSAKPVQPSLAPAMDIVVPSNFERFLFWFFGNDTETLSAAMRSIKEKGTMPLGAKEAECMRRLGEIFLTSRASDAEIEKVTAACYEQREYLVCPHTATGLHAVQQHTSNPKSALNGHSSISFATAHPGKFGDALEKSRQCAPALPPQLDGLLGRETRCRELPHDIDALRALMDADLEERSSTEVTTGVCVGRVGLVACIVAVAGLCVLRQLTK